MKKSGQQNLGVYLNLKTKLKATDQIFEYSDKETKNVNTFINKKGYIYMNEFGNNITQSGNQNELLLLIQPEKEQFYIDNMVYKNNKLNFENLRKEIKYLWYVINSESNENPNEDYYLEEGDIIKIGKVRLLVNEIFIKKEEKKGGDDKDNINIHDVIKKKSGYEVSVFDGTGASLSSGASNLNNNEEEKKKEKIYYKKCDFCDDLTFRLCKCEEYQHISCLKNWIKKRKFGGENKKQTGDNFYFPVFFCKEYIKKDPNCYYCSLNCLNCEYCKTFIPFKFKYFNEEEKKDIIEDLYSHEFKKPKDSSYIILESLEYKDKYSQYLKSMHIIKLKENNEIIIGLDEKNDVILKNISVNKQHSMIKYINGKILLKNLSPKAGTLVLIK